MHVAVDGERRPEVADQSQKRNEPDVRRVLGLGRAEGRRVCDQDVQLAPALYPLQPDAELEPDRPPSHLTLRVLVGPLLVANAAAEAGDAKSVLDRKSTRLNSSH